MNRNGSAERVESDEKRTPGAVRRLMPLFVIVALLAVGYLTGLHKLFSLDTLIREHETLTVWVDGHLPGAIVSYLAIYIAAVAVSFPGASLLTIVGGFLFGVVLGTILTVVGATAGAAIIFMVAKTSLGATLRARAGQFAQKLARGFEANAFSYLLSLRLQPILPFWIINVAPALFKVPLSTYIAATALGIIPGTVAYNLLGDGLGDLIAAQEAANPGCADAGTCAINLKALVSPTLIAALVALSLAALLPNAVRWWRQRGTEASQP